MTVTQSGPPRDLPSDAKGETPLMVCSIPVESDLPADEDSQHVIEAPTHGSNTTMEMNLSDNERRRKHIELGSTFAYWSGSISFAGFVAIIGSRNAGTFCDDTKMRYMNVAAACLACIFMLSLLLVAMTKLVPARPIFTVPVKLIIALIISLFMPVSAFLLALLF